MEKVIEEKKDKFMEVGFCNCIGSISQYCKLVTLARNNFI